MEMNTIIEIYDKEPIFNVLSPSIMRPSRVIYLGARFITRKRQKEKLIRYFSLRSPDTYIYFYPVNLYNCENVRNILREILEHFPDAVIDITGGSSTLVFAVGMFCAEYQIPVFAYNRRTNCFCNIFRCSEIEGIPCNPQFTVEQVLSMAGGMLLRHGHISPNEVDEGLLQNVDEVFSICHRNKTRWNGFVQYLQATTTGGSERPLLVRAPKTVLNASGKALFCDMDMMRRLEKMGMIFDLQEDGRYIRYRFRSRLVRQCLNDIGIWLELYVYKSAVESGLFDDVQISAIVDWNGVADEKCNTINEIDVILTYGITPVFISCKSGTPTTTALNELETLTRLFGGKYARGILVTLSDAEDISLAVSQRAADMGIRIIQHANFKDGGIVRCLLETVIQEQD